MSRDHDVTYWWRPRLRLQMSLVLVVLAAIGFAGYAQISQARREERLQRAKMMRALPLRAVRRLFGELGLSLLKNPSPVEVLGVDLPSLQTSRFGPSQEPPTHVLVELSSDQRQSLLVGAVPILEDGSHYFHINVKAAPSLGLRFRQGVSHLDLLFDQRGPNHLDLWTFVHDGQGQCVHQAGPSSIEHQGLYQLLDRVVTEAMRAKRR